MPATAPEKSKPSWDDLRRKPKMILSASQFETAELCIRKWWLAKVRKLTSPTTHSQAFGTVLHAVVERYLLADDTGRVACPSCGGKGQRRVLTDMISCGTCQGEGVIPVDLYPSEWHIAKNRYGGSDGEVTPAEQDLIRLLVSAAIEQGILERFPGRAVEKSFMQRMFPASHDARLKQIWVTGFIDLLMLEHFEVVDHKTSKSVRWLKSVNALKKNTQALLYGKVALDMARQEGMEIPEEITIRHNGFVKDPDKPQVRATIAKVPVESIQRKFSDLQELAQTMMDFREMADNWKDLPDPDPDKKACFAYGGCEYLSICGGRESEQMYQVRIDKIAARAANPPAPIPQKEGLAAKMAKLTPAQKLAKAKKIRGEAAADVKAPPKKTKKKEALNDAPVKKTKVKASTKAQAPAEQSDAQGVDHSQSPPWAFVECPVCKGLGFNNRGMPCVMCQAKSKVKIADYIVESLDDGTSMWVNKENEDDTGVSPHTVGDLPAVKAKTEEEDEEYEEVSDEEQDETEEEVEEAEKEPEILEAPDQPPRPTPKQIAATAAKASGSKSRGRPRKGLLLIINASVMGSLGTKKSGRFVNDIRAAFKSAGQTMANEAKVEHYFDLDPFKRREAFERMGALIAEEWGADMAHIDGVGTGQCDLKAFVDGIHGSASVVIGSYTA